MIPFFLSDNRLHCHERTVTYQPPERSEMMAEKYSAGSKDKVIAVVLACFSNDEQLRIMKKIAAESGKHHCKTVFFSTLTDFYFDDLNDAGEKKIFEAVCVERFDAIVLMSESFKQDAEQIAMVKRAHEAHVPVIAVDKPMEGSVNLAFDYGDTFREIVKHMVEFHGYRTINFMGGIPGNDFSEERLNVFKEVLAENNIPLDEKRIYYGYFWENPTQTAMDKMLQDGLDGVEAVICANDAMAITVSNRLQLAGYRVPEDIAVSGFDGIDMEKYCRPRLTTGVSNIDEFIRLTFEILDNDCPEKYLKEQIPIYNKMQIGQSCGCKGCETMHVASEMIQLKSQIHKEIKYQMDMSQLVANYGNAESLHELLHAVPGYMTELQYKDFWFCANGDLIEEEDLNPNPVFCEEGSSYTRELQVIHCRNSKEGPEIECREWIPFGELIPDRAGQLAENNYLLVLPMHIKGKTVGYAVASFDMGTFWFTAYASFITSLRYLIGMQKSQRKLMRVYMCDSLTGLYNRNGFYQKIQALMDTSSDMDMTIISLDMDGLKHINDTFGHAEGDAALKALGNIMRSSICHEIAARIGGDEFLIAFVGQDIEDRAEEIVRSIKAGIRSYNAESTKPYELHASIGSYTNRLRNHSLDHFLKQADDLMYARKYIHKKEKGDI